MALGRDRNYDAAPITCHACAARDRTYDAWRNGKGDMAGVYFPISERG